MPSSEHTDHSLNKGFDTSQNTESDNSLDKTFEKMEKHGIPADIFGNINPDWKIVMKRYYQAQSHSQQEANLSFEQTIEKIEKHCQNKYGAETQKMDDCLEQAQFRIMNHYQKPKELSEILLCNFANKCLIRGNTVDFCTQEVMKERTVINRESLKRLRQIEEYL